MNPDDLAKKLLEAADDSFNAEEYVKEQPEEASTEIYAGPLATIIIPHSVHTINDYLYGDRTWTPEEFQRASKHPLFVVYGNHDKNNRYANTAAIVQFETDAVWNSSGGRYPVRDLSKILAEPIFKDAQSGFTQYFQSQIAQKKNAKQAVSNLVMIGRTDLAANYSRYLGHAKLPMGTAIETALHLQKAGKRQRNKIARLMKRSTDVLWKDNGFYLLFDDWSDTVKLFKNDGRHDFQRVARDVFNGSTRDWMDAWSYVDVDDYWDSISQKNIALIRQLLVGLTCLTEDNEEFTITTEMANGLDDEEVMDVVKHNKDDATSDIVGQIKRSAVDAEENAVEEAYTREYTEAVLDALGADKTKRHWMAVKTDKGMQEKLAFFFPYSTLEEWLAQWREEHGEDEFEFDGDISDLAFEYAGRAEPSDEISHNGIDDDYFNGQLSDALHEVNIKAPPRQEPEPGQTEMPLDDPDKPAQPLHQTKTVVVGEPPEQRRYKGVPEPEAKAYQAKVPKASLSYESLVTALLEREEGQSAFHMPENFDKVTEEEMKQFVGKHGCDKTKWTRDVVESATGEDPKEFVTDRMPMKGWTLKATELGGRGREWWYLGHGAGWRSSAKPKFIYGSAEDAEAARANVVKWMEEQREAQETPISVEVVPVTGSTEQFEVTFKDVGGNVKMAKIYGNATDNSAEDAIKTAIADGTLSHRDAGAIYNVRKLSESDDIVDPKDYVEKPCHYRIVGEYRGETVYYSGPDAWCRDQYGARLFDSVDDAQQSSGFKKLEPWMKKPPEVEGIAKDECACYESAGMYHLRAQQTITETAASGFLIMNRTSAGMAFLSKVGWVREQQKARVFSSPEAAQAEFMRLQLDPGEVIIVPIKVHEADEAVDPKEFVDARVPSSGNWVIACDGPFDKKRRYLKMRRFGRQGDLNSHNMQWVENKSEAYELSHPEAVSWMDKLSERVKNKGWAWIEPADVTLRESSTIQTPERLDEDIYKNSTTQIDLPDELGQHIISWGKLNVPDDALYIDEDGGSGRETEQHVTVLYGLKEATPSDALKDIIGNTKPFLVELSGVTIFENEKYDVVKLDVISEELTNLSNAIRKACPNNNKFPDYHGHVTIAYVKPGRGKEFVGQDVFKAAQVSRDFWAYEVLFKGAGDSDDPNRVVDVLYFDKEGDPGHEDPKPGPARYPKAQRVDLDTLLAQVGEVQREMRGESEEVDPKEYANETTDMAVERMRNAIRATPKLNSAGRELLGFQLLSNAENLPPEHYGADDVLNDECIGELLYIFPEYAIHYRLVPIYLGDIRNPIVFGEDYADDEDDLQESAGAEVDPKEFVNDSFNYVVCWKMPEERVTLYWKTDEPLSDTGDLVWSGDWVQDIRHATRMGGEEAAELLDYIRSDSNTPEAFDIVPINMVAESENDVDPKEFVKDITVPYVLRLAVNGSLIYWNGDLNHWTAHKPDATRYGYDEAVKLSKQWLSQDIPDVVPDDSHLPEADSLEDPKEFVRTVSRPIEHGCPECHGHNLSEPDDEGLIDCLDCGIWFNPTHPNNLGENEQVDPKQFVADQNYVVRTGVGAATRYLSRHNGQYVWIAYPDDALSLTHEAAVGMVTTLRRTYDDVRIEMLDESDEHEDPKEFLDDTPYPCVIRKNRPKDHVDREFYWNAETVCWGPLSLATVLPNRAAGEDYLRAMQANLPGGVKTFNGASVEPHVPVTEASDADPKDFVQQHMPPFHHKKWEGNDLLCTCGKWRYNNVGHWSSSVPNSLREFTRHVRAARKEERSRMNEQAMNTDMGRGGTDPKEFVNSYLVFIKKGVGHEMKYLHEVPAGGSFVFAGREHATAFDQDRAAQLIRDLFPDGKHIYQPVRTELVHESAKQVQEAAPFDGDDGLPGDVTSFLRKVRSKRKKVSARPVL